jgi:outer membrane receptor protein involved in Fe transport
MIIVNPIRYRRSLLLCTILLCYTLAQAQVSLSGRIQDSTGLPLPHATIKLLSDSDKPFRTIFSDTAGGFRFPGLSSGRYRLESTYLGLTFKTAFFDLERDSSLSIRIGDSRTVLKSVTVTANKPLIERKIDRIIFNVENSIAAKGMDLTQALELTPLVRVDATGVSIIGKSGVAIMVNDRMLHLGGTELLNYLRSLRSDDISRIEIITAPPAKYEAQGNSGIINIVLKTNPNMGFNGTLSTSYIQDTYPGYSNSASLNYQSGKMAATLRLRQYDNVKNPTEELNTIGATSILSSDNRKDMNYGYGANAAVDYKLSKNSTVGFIYDVGESHYNINDNNISVYQTNGVTDSTLNTFSRQRNPALTQTLDLYFDQKLSKKGSLLSTGFNYFSTIPNTTVNFQTKSDQNPDTEFVENTSLLNYSIWSVQSDLTIPFKWIHFESGAKFTDFDNNSNIGYYNLIAENYIMDSTKSNIFKYNEKDAAGYVSVDKEFNPKWSAKGGLRYEYTFVDGYTPGETEHTKFDYGKLFPSFYLAWKADKNNTISFNYTRRINRPNFRALNPFRWYSNPYSYSTGNPLLQPSYNNNFEIDYLYKSIFSLAFYVQKTDNGFGRLTQIDSSLKIVNYMNYLTQYNSGMEATLAIKIFSWWENREFFSFNFSNSKSSIPDVLVQNGFAVYASTYNTFTLTKGLSLYVNFWHSFPATVGNIHNDSRSDLSSGLKIKLGENFQLNASVDDITRGTVSQGEIYYEDFTQYFNNYYDSRRATVSLTYNFGKSKVKGARKRVDFRETQRAN